MEVEVAPKPSCLAQAAVALETLPDELLLYIISFLEPKEVVPLHKTSHRLRAVTREEATLWRNATIYSHEERLRKGSETKNVQLSLPRQTHSQSQATGHDDAETSAGNGDMRTESTVRLSQRSMSYGHFLPANMLSSNHSKIDWYEEYKWRFAPLRMNWLDYSSHSRGWEDVIGSDDDDELGSCPSASYSSTCSSSASLGSQASNEEGEYGDYLEIRGVTAFPSVPSSGGKDLLLSPLSDGGVAIFDLRRRSKSQFGGTGKMGIMLGRSRPGLVTVEISAGGGSYLVGGNGAGFGGRVIKAVAPLGVVDCVSVDAWAGKGYVAVEGRLVEVDLRTLTRTSVHPFPFTITSLSQTSHPFPLTVGTTNMLHLHDPRISPSTSSASSTNATLFQPGPLSILHSNSNGVGGTQAQEGEEMIYVAGRFPSVLVYERRMFPRLKMSLHSGARLSDLSSFPAPGSGCGVGTGGIKNGNGNGQLREIIVTVGEYNGRGTLELYPSPYGDPKNIFPLSKPTIGCSGNGGHGRRSSHCNGIVKNSATSISTGNSLNQPDVVTINRQSASRAKILTVEATQGGRIITGDAEGVIRFMERDGRGEIRRYEINGEDMPHGRRIRRRPSSGGGRHWGDGNAGYSAPHSWSGEIVRKVVAFGDVGGADGYSDSQFYKYNESGIIVWTGEKVGILSVGNNKQDIDWHSEGEGGLDTEEESESKEARYRREMRQALEHHGREGWFLGGLGRER